ncbi:hypothetical protein HanHA300_Chr17g0673201 [Helianthus annuus]|nr:hypothetical protein HanHA300_Chr17g0673201 [Helianthus annuus]KAJ0637908.1 hypothetical protein HanOQP8_Chr17g0679301 [Helianthus annuus]
MVEILAPWWMISPLLPRGIPSLSTAFAFGSCKEGWYFRCIGNMLLMKHKKNHAPKVSGNRLLISVTVVGSAGPIRFVVNEEELVATVIDTALKSYAREGRLPVLGSNFNDFVLCCPVIGTEALKPWERIGSFGVRNFMLCKKPQADGDGEKPVVVEIPRKSFGSWKAWFNKSIHLKISSH